MAQPELNYSSDIDLIFATRAMYRPKVGVNVLKPEVFYTKVAQKAD
ncbi:hypothetical protein P4S68_10170 [Pseudoalteromonas sp. Hal099]